MKKLLLIAFFIACGILLQLSGLLNAEKLLTVAREYAGYWWLAYLLVLVQAILFTFALAGSIFLWVAAPLYPPLTAALILAAGATLGGVSAYFLSRKLSDEWVTKVEHSRTYKLIQQQDNFFTLFALRVFPAFPHSLINYSSGMLHVKLSHFISSAFLGIGIKSYIYANVIYNLSETASVKDLLSFSTYGPLILLSVFVFSGVFIKYKWLDNKKGA